MSSGDGHSYITFGWIATICFLLLFAAMENSQRRTVYQSTYYQKQCAQNHPSSPFGSAYGITSLKQPESAQSDRELRNQPDWCDLAAQQSVAEDTASMRLIAWFGFFSGVAGVTLLIWTLVETRNSVAVTREIGEKQTRCYVSLEQATVEVCGLYPMVRFWLKNYGQSPALAVTSSIQTSVRAGLPIELRWESNPATLDDAIKNQSNIPGLIGGDGEADQKTSIMSGSEFISQNCAVGFPTEMWAIIDSKKPISVDIDLHVAWTDVFDRRHGQTFYLSAELPPGGGSAIMQRRYK